jgi:hypothetical protein
MMHARRNGRESRPKRPLLPTITPYFALLLIILERRRCAKVVEQPQLAYKTGILGGGWMWELINNHYAFHDRTKTLIDPFERSPINLAAI